MILFDTETTGLVQPDARPLSKQPYIIEFAAIKLKDIGPFKELDRIEFKCTPGFPLSEEIIKITGLTDDDLKDEQPFAAYYTMLTDFFLGEKYLVGHNVNFDTSLLRFALGRMGKVIQFPWPPVHIDTVTATYGLKGYRLNLDKLYFEATGKPREGRSHRAMQDVEDLRKCLLWCIEKGHVVLK